MEDLLLSTRHRPLLGDVALNFTLKVSGILSASFESNITSCRLPRCRKPSTRGWKSPLRISKPWCGAGDEAPGL